MANEDKQEASRRKMFIKAAHIVIKDWPGYAADAATDAATDAPTYAACEAKARAFLAGLPDVAGKEAKG